MYPARHLNGFPRQAGYERAAGMKNKHKLWSQREHNKKANGQIIKAISARGR